MKRYRPRVCYLYALVFPNRKLYFGIAHDVKKRFFQHLRHAVEGQRNYPVYQALRKYDGVYCKVVCSGTRQAMATLEIWSIAEFGTLDRRFGYNLAPGGNVSPMHNPEIAAKVSIAYQLRWIVDPAYREMRRKQGEVAIAAAQSSPNTYSEITNQSRANKLVNRKISPERVAYIKERMNDPVHAAPIIAAMRKAWEDPELQAREHIRKKNQVVSQKQKDQISATLMGHPGAGKGIPRPEISELLKTLVWVTDGDRALRIPKGAPLPVGWWFGRQPRVGAKISETFRNLSTYSG